MRTSTRAGVAGIACLIGLTVAGCSTDTPRATPTTSTVTQTVTAPPSSEAAAPAPAAGTESDPTDAPDTATADPVSGGSPCGPYPDAAQKIADATSRIAPPSTTQPYRWGTIRSDMSSCNALSWAELTVEHGTASSADQLLLFGPDGTWLGTGIKCNAGLAWVTGSGSDHVDVHYGYFHGPHPSTADPGGGTDVTFRWNGSRVVLEGTLPQEFLDQCQQPS
jgi:hypothetical protein